MLYAITSKKKCACCHSRKTSKSLVFDYCDIHIEIPLCEECQKTATFNLAMQLKPLCTAISRAVTMSHIVGYDERKIAEYQRKERALKEGAENESMVCKDKR